VDAHSEDELLPLSALEHLVFCERQCALIHIEQAWAESAATVEGHRLHDSAHEVGTDLRCGVRIARALMLRSLRLGLTGKTDVVEFHELAAGEPEASGAVLPGVPGRWRPFPVEFKRGKLRHEASYAVQVCAQALCLEEMLGVPVPEGALFYGKSVRRQRLVFDDELRRQTEAAAERLHEMFAAGITPKAVYVPGKCRACSLVERCVPESTDGHHSAGRYLTRIAAPEEGP
jgi:CRISPR-associated exonuclease Cas4